MNIDWFTVGAQILNFLVLVWLLQHFLYGPITRAMDRREQRIGERLQQAEDSKAEAQRETQALREQQAVLARERDRLLEQARLGAEREQRRLREAAENEVGEQRRAWLAQLHEQQAAFIRSLRRLTSEHVYKLARRALGDLADAALEDQIARALVKRLAGLSDADKYALAAACRRDGNAVVVNSRFDLSSSQRSHITRAVHEQISRECELQYRETDVLSCGIELRFGDKLLRWSVDAYLDDLESSVAQHIAVLADLPDEGAE